jgi:hypothetical protein
MTRADIIFQLAVFSSLAKNTLYVFRNKIFPNRYYRKILHDSKRGYSYAELRKIFKKSIPYSQIWHEILERIIEVKAKYILENSTRKDMKIPIKSFVEFFNKIRLEGIPDYFEIVVRHLEFIIDSCDCVFETKENMLITRGNLLLLKERLRLLQNFNMPEDDKKNIEELILSVDKIIGKVLVKTMEDYPEERKLLKIVYNYDEESKKWQRPVYLGDVYMCDMHHLSPVCASSLVRMHHEMYEEIKLAEVKV